MKKGRTGPSLLQASKLGSFLGGGFLLTAALSCGEQIVDDTRQVPGNNIRASAPSNLGAPTNPAAPNTIAAPPAAGPTATATPGALQPPVATVDPGPAQPVATASPTPAPTATPRPIWEPENIYRIVERNCMTPCHVHVDIFSQKHLFLLTKNRSLTRMLDPAQPNPMPPVVYFPNFDGSADEATLAEWLRQQ